ncbi:unnamed protein product [Microthlaspi erraticum]|uniref:F-box domain-containing protein n=1 Tax=Microthlaspi erraticum TaxID=1685480 RepID=A0A6D2IZY9_9BRAS|nr:unnamed protein product [Microthlaspi erraticum]
MTSSKQRSWLMVLPCELVEEILYRIPIKSVCRFKSVCKQWYAFFNDKGFTYKHLDLSDEGIIGMDQKSFQLFNVEPKARLSLPTPDELHNYIIEETIHCDGLLLCKCIGKRSNGYTPRYIYGETTKTKKLAVWNPVLSQVIWIEPSTSSPYKTGEFYGFGYDNVSRDNYKILRIHIKPDGYKGKSSPEIYEFKSKLWRSVNADLDWYSLGGAVSMNGDVYWIAEKKMDTYKIELLIQSFDLSTETFKPICCVPDGVANSRLSNRIMTAMSGYGGDGITIALSGYGGDRLSLLRRHEHLNFEVWVTSKLTDDGVVSWSKYFNLTPNPLILISKFRTNFILKTRKSAIMLWCEERRLKKKDIYTTVYELGGEGEIKKQVEFTRPGCDSSCDEYVPTWGYDSSCDGYVPAFLTKQIIVPTWGDDRSCNVFVPSLVPLPQ